MPGYCHRVAPRPPNAICPNRPSRTEFRKKAVQVWNEECGVRPNLISIIAKLRATSRHDPLPLRNVDFKWFTTSLIPAFSPRRRRIVRRLHENSHDWIYRTLIRTTRIAQLPFPLPGERIKGEGGRKTQIQFALVVHPKMISRNRILVRENPAWFDFLVEG